MRHGLLTNGFERHEPRFVTLKSDRLKRDAASEDVRGKSGLLGICATRDDDKSFCASQTSISVAQAALSEINGSTSGISDVKQFGVSV